MNAVRKLNNLVEPKLIEVTKTYGLSHIVSGMLIKVKIGNTEKSVRVESVIEDTESANTFTYIYSNPDSKKTIFNKYIGSQQEFIKEVVLNNKQSKNLKVFLEEQSYLFLQKLLVTHISPES